ncbi:ATPase AFG1-like protein [Macrophomina phaseolina MS6]|uniref:ATPase AFG1-like protein n=1 Tax=Macrophomina phaseolina (strain MS6) TaxID=1126212 RepID=K2SGK2_MACPH|nr:ATPase AFG1-like protein [Macrophomina phaseolina MS6]
MESLKWRLGVKGRSENMFAGRGDFAPFLEVLKARCEVWEMEGGKDYRRSESEVVLKAEDVEGAFPHSVAAEGQLAAQSSAKDSQDSDAIPEMASMPKQYFVKPSTEASTSEHEEWLLKLKAAESLATGVTSPSIPWTPSTMRVYGRQVHVPRQHNGVTSWTFSELCASQLGPADYITLASTFHTLILTDVPVLSLLQKNEARRFITLLDALYEARCKLLVTAAAGPDDIFFPESRKRAPSNATTGTEENVDQDAVYSETFSDIYQDATAPFRPNISSYDGAAASSTSEPEPFIDTTQARLQGLLLAEDALEDDPPNRVRRGTHTGSFGADRDYENSNRNKPLAQEQTSQTKAPDFALASAFTGEDERFAYKRARSRLWEMCGGRWWARDCAQLSWWTPVSREVRRWEMSIEERAAVEAGSGRANGDVSMGAASEIDEKRDEPLFRHEMGTASPFRTWPGPPPKIGWTHVWGTMKWGRKAGAWGKGVEGLEERKREKERERDGEEKNERRGTEGEQGGEKEKVK